MGAEMPDGVVRVWRKAIPEGRDKWQSRGLVWVVGCLLVWMNFLALERIYFYLSEDDNDVLVRVLTQFGISVAFSLLVLVLRAATRMGAAFGGMICFVMIAGTASLGSTILRSALMPLTLLFVLTFLSTRAGRRRKAEAGLAEGRKGRSAAQVIANLSVAALAVSPLGHGVAIGSTQPWRGTGYAEHWAIPVTMLMCLAALVEATADTVSSEIGQAFGGRPLMVLSFRRVEVGTDGAVTLLGSGAGILAGALVAVVGMWGLGLSIREACVSLAAGVCGLFFDSLLGATLERRGWLGNDLVNFASTVFAAGVAAFMYRVFGFGG